MRVLGLAAVARHSTAGPEWPGTAANGPAAVSCAVQSVAGLPPLMVAQVRIWARIS